MSNKILLADDSITIQKVVNLTFTDEGINVVTVGNGELALKKLSEEPFDLVLADIFMPGRNGYEVCDYIKSNPQFGDIPVILLVGAFEPFDKSEAARVRADGHLTKPFESRILIETVKRMLAESAIRRTPVPAPVPEGTYKGKVVGWDVPTQQMEVAQFEESEAEPEPPPYDPYASTQKLPMVGDAIPEREPASMNPAHTMAIGSPISTGALFSNQADGATEPPDTYDTKSHAMTFDEADTVPAATPIDGPPDAVAGFSMSSTSGPLMHSEPETESPFGYRDIHASDSPLDLPPDLVTAPAEAEEAVIEQHAHEPAVIDEVRDPLVETFADAADTTAGIAPESAPGLETNIHPDVEPSMTVQPSDDVTSTWDPGAQPPSYSAVVEAAPAESPEIWHTQSYSADEVPFALPPEEPSQDSPALSSWTAEVEEPVEEVTADHGSPVVSDFADEAVYEEAVHTGEPAAVTAHSNGSGASLGAIPADLMDEIVRRTVARMSDDVIREIAWDVVPELAEQIIRKRLSGNG